MASKKKTVKRKAERRCAVKRAQAPTLTLFYGHEEDFSSNGTSYEQPHYKNPETAEQRAKRLAKREALTLRAFQIAYDNNHPRKSS